MTIYIQYDENGNILATVQSYDGRIPPCINQLIVEDNITTEHKKIDMGTMELMDSEEQDLPEE